MEQAEPVEGEKATPEAAAPAAAPTGEATSHLRGWFGWGLLASAFVMALCACSVYGFDAGMLLAKGRWIVEHRALPPPETFLVAKNSGFQYVDRWGAYVLWWWAYSAGGWDGLIVAKMLLVLGTFACLWRAARPAGPLACAAATLFASLLMYERWDVRTELFAHAFAAAALAILPAHGEDVGKRLWLLPGLALVAINIHSLNVLVGVLAAMAAVAAAIVPATRPHAKKLAIIAAISIVALLLNPQGWRVFSVPFEYLHRYRTGPDWYRGWIGELQGVGEDAAFPSVAMRAPFLVVPVAALALALNFRRARPWDIGLFLLGALAAFSVRRNVAAAGVLLFPVLARHLAGAGEVLLAKLDERTRAPARGLAALGVGSALAVLALLSTSDLWGVAERTGRRAGFGVNRLTLPVDACDFLEREGFKGDAFVNWDAGGIYMLARYPASLPTMNGEGDFSLVTLKEYADATRDPDVFFEAYAAKYDLRLAVLTHQSADTRAVAAWLNASPDWALVWRDACALVFARRGGVNAELTRRFASPPAPALPAFGRRGLGWWGEGRRRAAAVEAYRLGTVSQLFGDKGAAWSFQVAIELWPGYPEAHNNLGVEFGAKRDARAEQEFREAIRLAPKYATAWRNLARYFMNRGDRQSAMRTLEDGLKETGDEGLRKEREAMNP